MAPCEDDRKIFADVLLSKLCLRYSDGVSAVFFFANTTPVHGKYMGRT